MNTPPQKAPTPDTPAQDTSPKPNPTDTPRAATLPKVLRSPHRDLAHYAAYFLSVGGLVFVAQGNQPTQLKQSVIAGAIASGAVISRDWFKARLDPSMASDPSALISLFNEMLHAGRAQVNVNAAHLKRVEFLQVDLKDALVSFNDLLRLEPDEIAAKLQAAQSMRISEVLSMPMSANPPATPANPTGDTHLSPAATLRQSFPAGRPGFDA